jgi:hypothetical protein
MGMVVPRGLQSAISPQGASCGYLYPIRNPSVCKQAKLLDKVTDQGSLGGARGYLLGQTGGPGGV